MRRILPCVTAIAYTLLVRPTRCLGDGGEPEGLLDLLRADYGVSDDKVPDHVLVKRACKRKKAGTNMLRCETPDGSVSEATTPEGLVDVAAGLEEDVEEDQEEKDEDNGDNRSLRGLQSVSYAHLRVLHNYDGAISFTCQFCGSCEVVSSSGLSTGSTGTNSFYIDSNSQDAEFVVKFTGPLNRPELHIDDETHGFILLVASHELHSKIGDGGRTKCVSMTNCYSNDGWTYIYEDSGNTNEVVLEFQNGNDQRRLGDGRIMLSNDNAPTPVTCPNMDLERPEHFGDLE